MLAELSEPLASHYDLGMLDLDGVVYISGAAVAGAAEHLARARAAGMHLAFITNNAARPAHAVAQHLRELGIEASPSDVVTSAQAAARLLRDRFGAGARVVCLGGPGLWESVREAGLEPVAPGEVGDALVTGYGPDVLWRDIMQAAVALTDGLPWVASNTDHTLPTATGKAPGHGVLVDTLARYAGVTPLVAGKPARPLLDETVRRVGGSRPLMIGDRLDTDIEGAHNAGVDSMLVLTGVTGLRELVAAEPELRPTYLAPDLGGLAVPHGAPVLDAGAWALGGWTAQVEGGAIEVSGGGATGDWWRVVAAAAWQHLDDTGEVVDATGLVVPCEQEDGR